ncbi:MAG: hypothetical protein ABH881_03530 [bacterium]
MNFKKILLIIFIFTLGAVFCAGSVIAQDIDDSLKGLDKTAQQGYGSVEEGSGTIVNIPGAIGRFVGTGLSMLGVIFLLLMIFGGARWMFSQGNEQEVQAAKNLMEAAVIGLIIVLSAYGIVTYLGNYLFSQTSPGTTGALRMNDF